MSSYSPRVRRAIPVPPQVTTTAKDSQLPVSLPECVEHLRVEGNDLDDQAEAALLAATEYVEKASGRSLRISQTVEQTYTSWPLGYAQLTRQPVRSITSVTYYDLDNTEQTLAAGRYRLIAGGDMAAWLEFADDFVKPTFFERSDAVKITYVAGYESIAEVPAAAKHAIRQMAAYFFGDLDERQSAAAFSAGKRLIASIDWGAYR